METVKEIGVSDTASKEYRRGSCWGVLIGKSIPTTSITNVTRTGVR